MFFRQTLTSALLVLTFSLPVIATATIKLAVGEWPPYFSATMKENGVYAHIVKEAFQREGISVHYSFYPWKRALQLTKEGEAAASPGWKVTDERSKDFLFSNPVIISKTVLFFRKNTPLDFKTIENLAGKTVGTTNGYSYGEYFDNASKQGTIKTDPAPNDELSLKKLLAGRIDMVAMNRTVGFDILSRFPPDERNWIIASNKSIDEQPSRLAISRTYPNALQLMDTFNLGLAKISQDGTLQKLLKDAESGGYHLPGN